MYCRICGMKMKNDGNFCSACGAEKIVLKQPSDVDIFAKKAKQHSQCRQDQNTIKLHNPFVAPAIITAVIAFALAAFPWPSSWNIGTSIEMRVTILIVAFLALFLSRKSKQLNRLHLLRYHDQKHPNVVKTASILSACTMMAALFTLFMM